VQLNGHIAVHNNVRTTTASPFVSISQVIGWKDRFRNTKIIPDGASNSTPIPMVIAAARQPANWRRPPWRPSHTWLRSVEDDYKQLNFGLATAWRMAANRDR